MCGYGSKAVSGKLIPAVRGSEVAKAAIIGASSRLTSS
jgi:hypothetical protein